MRTIIITILLLILCVTDTKYIPDVGKPLYTIMCTGQSIGAGTKSAPAISIEQPYENLMLSGRYGGQGNGTNVEYLIEGLRWETPSSGMANTITKLDSTLQIAIALHAQNGAAYNDIKKSTPLYKKGLSQIRHINDYANHHRRPHRIIATTLIHGETDDANAVSKDEYKKYLVEFQKDKDGAGKTVTGQTEDIPLFLCQTTSFSSDYLVNRAISDMPMAQLEASEENEGIFCVTPRYIFPCGDDGAHLTGGGSQWLGEYYGKVIKRVVFDNEDWKPLMPVSINLIDSIVVIDYHVPRGHIVFDTNLVIKHDNYGFEFFGDTSTTIYAVKITDINQVQITLSKIPTGDSLQIGYAHTAERGTHSGPNNPHAIGGNIRDTDNETGPSGRPLYNWMVQGIWHIKKE